MGKHAKKSVFKLIVVVTAVGDIFEEEDDFVDPKVVGRVVLGIGKDVCKVVKMVLGMEAPNRYSSNSYERFDYEDDLYD